MSWKKIIILLAILALLAAGILLVNRREKQKQAGEGRLVNLAADKVARIELQRGDLRLVLVKNDPFWNLELPIQARASKVAVENILDDFCNLKYDRMVEKECRDLGRYGLDKPEIELRLFEKGMTQPVAVIQLGIKNELDSSSYAKLSSANQVVLIAGYRRGYLEKEVFDFRDKKFFEFDTTQVTALGFQFQDASYQFSKKGDQWFMEKPLFSLAQESKLTDILSRAATLEAKTFKEKSSMETRKAYGFDKPLIDVTLTMKSGTKKLQLVKKNDLFYAITPEFPEICEIDKEFSEKFLKEAKEYREYKVLPFFSFEVMSIEFKGVGFSFSAQKDKEQNWRITQPATKETPDIDKINALLGEIQDLEARDFIDQPSSPAGEFPFAITLKTGSGESGPLKTIRLLLGQAKDNAVTARNPDLPYLFKVEPAILDKLPKKLADLTRTEEEKKSPAGVTLP